MKRRRLLDGSRLVQWEDTGGWWCDMKCPNIKFFGVSSGMCTKHGGSLPTPAIGVYRPRPECLAQMEAEEKDGGAK